MPHMLSLLFYFSSLGTYPTDLDVKRCRSHTHCWFFFSFVFLSFLSATRLIFFDLLTMCDICYILEQYTQTQPPSYFLENGPMQRTALAVLHLTHHLLPLLCVLRRAESIR
jgi:hypothetical protein